MARTSSIYDHFISWPLSVALTLNLPEQMFQITHLLFIDLDLQSTWANVSLGNAAPQEEQLC